MKNGHAKASTAIILGVFSIVAAHGASVTPKPTHRTPHSVPSAASTPCPSLHSGFFGGLKGGYAWAKGKLQNDALANPNGGPVPSGQRTTLGLDGGEVGLLLGYDHYFFKDWVLGVEGGAQWASLSGDVTSFSADPGALSTSNLKIRLSSDRSFDVALRFGHKVHEHSLWYVKVGAQFTRFKLNVQNIQIITFPPAINRGAPLAAKNRILAGFLAGLGVEIPVSSHISLGAEYNFTTYQSLNVSAESNNGNGEFIRTKVQPNENQIVARIIWKI